MFFRISDMTFLSRYSWVHLLSSLEKTWVLPDSPRSNYAITESIVVGYALFLLQSICYGSNGKYTKSSLVSCIVMIVIYSAVKIQCGVVSSFICWWAEEIGCCGVLCTASCYSGSQAPPYSSPFLGNLYLNRSTYAIELQGASWRGLLPTCWFLIPSPSSRQRCSRTTKMPSCIMDVCPTWCSWWDSTPATSRSSSRLRTSWCMAMALCPCMYETTSLYW